MNERECGSTNDSAAERRARWLGRAAQALVLGALLSAAIGRVLLHLGDKIAFRYQGF